MDWIECLGQALRYIETHLEAEMSAETVAAEVHFSKFYLQRTFTMLTGMTLGEYIRARRLSLAGQALQAGRERVLDVALRFAYDSPESFQKAFARFHGITPAAAKRPGAQLRYQPPLAIKFTLEGNTMLDYRIEQKDAFLLLGMQREFSMDDALTEIPNFWNDYYAAGHNKTVCGAYGVCVDGCGKNFRYLIGDNCLPDAPTPVGFARLAIPAFTWAIFSCTGPMPGALQKVNRQIFTEWLPGNPDYEIAGGYNIEMYTEGDTTAADYHSEIWIPVQKKAEKR